MKKLLFFIFSILLIFPFISSCIIAVVDFPNEAGFPEVQEFEKIVPLDAGGTLSLENIDGDIEIQGWDRNELQVFAEKIMPNLYDRKIRVFHWNYSVPKIEFDKFEDFVKIKTRAASGEDKAKTVHYEVRVPHSINLKDITSVKGDIFISDLYGEAYIELEDGDIKVDNFSGSLTASVENGSIRASLYDLRNEDELTISTKQGDIVVYLQPEVNCRIEASSPNGDIFCEFDIENPMPTNKISTVIGEDGASISLTTLNGNIEIKKIK